MLKRKLFLALAMASCAASSWLEAAVAGTCDDQPQNQDNSPNYAGALFRVAEAVAVFSIGISKPDPEFGFQDIADDLEKAKNDLFPPPDTKKEDVGQLLCQLQNQLQQDTSVLFVHDTLLAMNNDTGDLNTAINTAQQILKKTAVHAARYVMPGEEPDVDTQNAINHALFGNDEWWKRFATDQSNDGGTAWKQLITPASPDSDLMDGKTTTYEWRLVVPYVLNAFALRPHIIEAIDPYWRIDGSYDSELGSYADKLEEHLTKMKKGVQCGERLYRAFHPLPLHPSPNYKANFVRRIYAYEAACADIYTGLSQSLDTYPSHPISLAAANDAVNSFEAAAKSWVIEHMPLFEMQATVDRYRQYVSHAADLTQTLQRISLADRRNLCLEVKGGSAASGTPVVIGTCQDISAQKWVYDRDNREIYNPRLDKCLEVTHVYGQPVPWTAVVSADCDGSHYQQWTYNPNTLILSNPFGTALRADPPPLSPSVTVAELGSRWYADGPRPPRRCSLGILSVLCPSSGF